MRMWVECPNCGTEILCNFRAIGRKRVRCPNCLKVFYAFYNGQTIRIDDKRIPVTYRCLGGILQGLSVGKVLFINGYKIQKWNDRYLVVDKETRQVNIWDENKLISYLRNELIGKRVKKSRMGIWVY